MKLRLGFSPCPNDTFMFDALVHNKVDTEGLEFQVILNDVEELNKKALSSELDITKLSYHSYAYVSNEYIILNAGSALGFKNGPLLISKREIPGRELVSAKIAIPGINTTANLLLSIAYPELTDKKEYLFSDIETALLNEEIDAGLIIHENRFTYKEKGLQKISDLGYFWETETGLPIPLGGIVIKRNLSVETQQKADRVLRRSIEYAFTNPKSSFDYVKKHAQEMDEDVLYKHIGLYVNQFSTNIGAMGKKAVEVLYSKSYELNLIPQMNGKIFVPGSL